MTHVAFITGATAGFGAAMARRFVKEGWHVVLTGRRQERLDALQKELGEQAYAIAMDVTKSESIDAALAALKAPFNRIDVLVNNAGLALGTAPAPNTDMNDWRTMIDTNITGLAACTHAILPSMVSRGHGHIINIGSIAGTHPYPGGNVYGATKAFVHHFTTNLRADLLGTGVRATSIAPGLAETEFSVVRFKNDAAQAKSVYHGTQPLTAEDIAESVFWVANQPAHVNINHIEIMPTCQANAGLAIHRSA